MNTYLLITILILAGPLALSFHRKVAFFRRWKQLALSIPPVSAIYLLWDIMVTERGHWSFNPQYAGTWHVLGLPPGEWLFFLVVPYACLFILEVVRAYFPRRTAKDLNRIRAAATIGTVIGAYLFRDQAYTLLALTAAALWLLFIATIRADLLGDAQVWYFFLLATITFLLVNGVLTALPIVSYNPEAIWGIRIITIPLEDLFYNVSMLGFYLLSYETAGKRLEKKRD